MKTIKIVTIGIICLFYCTNILGFEPTDSLDFYSNYKNSISFEKRLNEESNTNKIEVKCKNQTYVFANNLSDEDFVEYHHQGYYKDWQLIQKMGYNDEVYYLINVQNDEVDTLIGYPKIYENKMVCLEGSHTDSKNRIDVWTLSNVQNEKIFSMNLIDIDVFYVDDFYLSDNCLYIFFNKNDEKTFLKRKNICHNNES